MTFSNSSFVKSSFKSFINAQCSDPVSAFGGVVACNYKITKKVALEMNRTLIESIVSASNRSKEFR